MVGARAVLAVVVGVVVATPAPGSAQAYHTSVTLAYSALVPKAMRGEMASDVRVGGAAFGGPFVSLAIERGTELGLRIEAVYSHHSCSPGYVLGESASGEVYAAEREDTEGVMASALIPLTHVGGSPLRLSLGVGVLRTVLRGHGVKNYQYEPVTDSNVAPALGAGLELPVPFAGHDVVLTVRGAQLASDKRGGGYLAAGVGWRW